MLDIKRIRQNPQEVQELLSRRGDIDITPVLEADEKRRKLITRAETLKAQQNSDQKQIPILKKEGKVSNTEAVQAVSKLAKSANGARVGFELTK